MSCNGFDERVSAWLDGEVSPEERYMVEAHLRNCAACQGQIAMVRQIQDWIRPSQPIVAPITLGYPVMGLVHAENRRRKDTSLIQQTARWLERLAGVLAPRQWAWAGTAAVFATVTVIVLTPPPPTAVTAGSANVAAGVTDVLLARVTLLQRHRDMVSEVEAKLVEAHRAQSKPNEVAASLRAAAAIGSSEAAGELASLLSRDPDLALRPNEAAALGAARGLALSRAAIFCHAAGMSFVSARMLADGTALCIGNTGARIVVNVETADSYFVQTEEDFRDGAARGRQTSAP